MRVSTPASITGGADRLRLGAGMAVLAVCGAVLLGACGSSSPSAGGTTAPTTSAPSGSSSSPSSSSSMPNGSTPTSGGALSSIAQELQKGQSTSFEVTYSVTGASSVKGDITYAVAPPSSFSFQAETSSGKTDIVSKGGTTVDACEQKSTTWTCVGVPDSSATAYTEMFQVFTGKYWYTDMVALQADAHAAGFTTSTSSMTLAGQSLNCVDWTGNATSGSGEVCVNSAGVLGYAHSSVSNTTLSLVSYTSSPPASTFEPPAGATVETIPAGA